jgi:hypothetical protein
MKISEAFTNLDRDVVKYLKSLPGKQIPNSVLAKHFDVEEAEMRQAIERQVKAKKIRTEVVSGRRKFFVPADTPIESPASFSEPRRDMKVYVPPQPMMELYARIRQEREAYPSKFEH